MVNVVKGNFIEQSNDFLRHLPQADFIAIDEEMTGISLPSHGRPRKDQPPSVRYDDAHKLVPERYSIIQLGVSLHRGRVARKYNFYVFPTDNFREVVLSPSAVQFLNQHGMSFDTWTKSGIPYCTRAKAADETERYLTAERKVQAEIESTVLGRRPQPSAEEALSRQVVLQRSEDVVFFARTMASLREWLDSGVASAAAPGVAGAAPAHQGADIEESGQAQLLLPPCNSFLRRALYENISKEYPNLVLETVPHDRSATNGTNNNPNFLSIRVLRLTPFELQQRNERLQSERWKQFILERIGMWRIVSAIRQVCQGRKLDYSLPEWAPSASDVNFDRRGGTSNSNGVIAGGRRIPLVVHNGLMDLLFLMTHFESPRLPDTLTECKQLLRSYFPLIYDTKVLSIEYCGYGEMNLQNLYDAVGDRNLLVMQYCSEEAGDIFASLDGADAHQADYDALMTGAVFVGLSKHLQPMEVETDSEEEGEVTDDEAPVRQVPSPWFNCSLGCNQLYSLGLYTVDLESVSDPLSTGLKPEYTFRVAGIEPSVTTRDIVSCLSALMDEDERPVNFDIVWVDDTTFIVATRYRPRSDATIATLVAPESVPSSPAGDDENSRILAVHGQLVRGALGARFGKDLIATLEDDSEDSASEARSSAGYWLARFLETVRLKRKTQNGNRKDGRPAKRQRRD